MADKFDRFTERARQVLTLAQQEAQTRGRNTIGTEHFLLGLVRQDGGTAARALANLGVRPPQVRAAVEARIGRGEPAPPGEIGLTPRAKRAIELAVDEARQLDHHAIGTEHLLLGLVREGEGIAAQILADLGVGLERARAQVIQAVAARGDAAEGRGRAAGQPDPAAPPRLREARLGLEALRREITAAIAAQDFNLASALRERERRLQERIGALEREGRADRQEAGQAPAGPPGDRFDRFTERARRVLTLAQEEAERFNHNYIGTEHLLLGLVREGDGIAARVLGDLGVQLPRVRSAVEFIIGRGEAMIAGEIGLTPRAKRVIDLAVDEAQRLNHHEIGTEHLLLGLVREGEGIAAGVLESMGVSLEQVRAQVIQVVASSPGAAAGRDATGPGSGGPPPGARPGQPAGVVHVPLDPLAGLAATAAGALAHLLATRRSDPPGEAPRPPGGSAALRAALLTGLGAAALLPAARAAVEAVRAGRRPFSPQPSGGWRGRIVRLGRPAPPPPPDPRAVQGGRSVLGPPGGVRIEPVGPPRGPQGFAAWSAIVEPPHAAPPRPAPPRPRPAPLGDLVRVVPVAQTQRQGTIEVAVTALELYANGFIVNMQLRGAGAEHPARGMPDLQLLASDERGGHYPLWPVGGSGGSEPAGWRWRMTYEGAPAPEPAARELRLQGTIRGWRRGEPVGQAPAAPESGLGPWSFTIPLGNGTGEGEALAGGKP